ncbi:uncharacterized protein LOC119687284 [Teleopsis dalmanni]|uniref:uncharacterized protein LOC119687284 n=1 Tax=Teleopsis dalmanni TaxID=139649 RepID=UPI0018CDC1B2|nr:uncharacterized protein LOC119687284 [Teleopsis dalmanni]
MSKSDSEHRLPRKTAPESKVQRSLSETDKLVADEQEKNVDDDLNMRHHSYLQTAELKLSSQDDHKAFRNEVIQDIIAIRRQIDYLEKKVRKLEEMVSTLETEKINKEKVGKLEKSNDEHLGFLKKESQKTNKETQLRNRKKVRRKPFPLSFYQGRPLDDLFIPDLSKCGKKRTDSQLEDEPETESEEEPEERSNIYLRYKIREYNLSFMSESSLALNKEWPVQLYPSLWPQRNFKDQKCDCLKQFRK